MIIDKRKYSRPSIVLGNGLNNHLNMDGDWLQLLGGISVNGVTKAFFEGKDLSYPEYYDALSFQNGIRHRVGIQIPKEEDLRKDINLERNEWTLVAHPFCTSERYPHYNNEL